MLTEGFSSSTNFRQCKYIALRYAFRGVGLVEFHALVEEGPRADLLIPHYNNYYDQKYENRASIILFACRKLGLRNKTS